MLIERLAAALGITLEQARHLTDSASFRYRPIEVGPVVRGRRRKVYAPHRPLRRAQRWLLNEIVAGLPVHEAATAYSRGSSPAKNARIHRGTRFLLRMDFARFFESICADDLRAHLQLVIGALPRPWSPSDTEDLIALVCRRGRLVMGAPTSPIIANSVCIQLDRLLQVAATERGLRYTRYSDDLYFSSTTPYKLSEMEQFVLGVTVSIDCPKGLWVNPSKTIHSSRGGRRRITGLILTPDGKVSIGRRRKREIRSLVHRYAELSWEDRQRLAGLLSWVHDVEPEFEERLIRKYGIRLLRTIGGSRRVWVATKKEEAAGTVSREANTPPNSYEGPRQPWMEKVSRLLARHRQADALRVIEHVIENEMPLFWGLPAIEHSRRVAWLYGIRLLRQMNRPSAALAWTCLECEVNPDNASAQVLKEQLKAELRLGADSAIAPSVRADVDWPGIAGMGPLKAMLERDVVRPLKDPALHRKYGLRPPNGIVFYGPPGCGKTHVARALGKVLGYSFREVKPSDLASIYVHGSQQMIAESFKTAEQHAPTVLFFDELDALIPSRAESGLHHAYRESVNEFLAQMNDCGSRGILVVGATNRREQIDPAALRSGRLEHHFFIGPPDFEGREAGVRQHMSGRSQESEIDWINIAAVSEGLSFADIELAVNQAARRAMETGKPIGTSHLLAAVEELRVR